MADSIAADPLLGLFESAIEYGEEVKPSTSVALIVPEILESSLPVTDISPVKMAGSSTAERVRLIICSLVPDLSSVTRTVNESLPLKFVFGS